MRRAVLPCGPVSHGICPKCQRKVLEPDLTPSPITLAHGAAGIYEQPLRTPPKQYRRQRLDLMLKLAIIGLLMAVCVALWKWLKL